MRLIHFAKIAVLLAAVIGLAFLSVEADDKPDKKRDVVFLVGDDLNHASGTHEFYAGAVLLKDSLSQSQLKDQVSCTVVNNWPENTSIFKRADVIGHYYKGNKSHFINQHHDLIDGLAKKGLGQLFIHYAIDPDPIAEPFTKKWTDAVNKAHFSANPHWNFKARLEEHPHFGVTWSSWPRRISPKLGNYPLCLSFPLLGNEGSLLLSPQEMLGEWDPFLHNSHPPLTS